MPFPLSLGLLLIFIAWMTYKIKYSDRKLQSNTKDFWKREREANSTRKRSLDSIPYITIPLSQLPILENPDETIAIHQSNILSLSEKKIANLSGQSNTDLKLLYGAANLDTLTMYDQNFTQLLRTLYQWGLDLYQEGLVSEAKSVLEYGVACKTDISKHYTLLAEIYKQENTLHKISDLIALANNLDSLMKPAILRSLNEIAESCHAGE